MKVTKKQFFFIKSILILLLPGSLIFCGKQAGENAVQPVSVPTTPTNNESAQAENAELEEGVWNMSPESKCVDNKCTNSPSKIPVVPRDLLAIKSLKARGITDGKYKNNPWIAMKFFTNHQDYLNKKIKFCFQNKFVVKDGSTYLTYIADNYTTITHLNIARVVYADKNCWSSSDSLIELYKNGAWHGDASNQLDQFLIIGEGSDVVEVSLGDSFKDNDTNKRINSEVIVEVEIQ